MTRDIIPQASLSGECDRLKQPSMRQRVVIARSSEGAQRSRLTADRQLHTSGVAQFGGDRFAPRRVNVMHQTAGAGMHDSIISASGARKKSLGLRTITFGSSTQPVSGGVGGSAKESVSNGSMPLTPHS